MDICKIFNNLGVSSMKANFEKDLRTNSNNLGDSSVKYHIWKGLLYKFLLQYIQVMDKNKLVQVITRIFSVLVMFLG